MSEAWYWAAGAEEPLTQGDVIFECPALSWRLSALRSPTGPVAVDHFAEAVPRWPIG